MPAPENRLRTRLLAGEDTVGLWLTLGSPAAAELAGGCGFDWCLIDAEHGPNGLSDIQTQLQVLAGTPAEAIVRVPVNVPWVIKQVLDTGAQSVMVPMVGTGDEARTAAAAVRYPPAGVRGIGGVVARSGRWGAIPDYTRTADAQILLIVQAESASAVEEIDAIAATDGVDAVFVGPADLAADMGFPGQGDHPRVLAAIERLIARTRAAGKVAGILTFDPAAWPRYRDMGARMIAVGAESFEMRRALADLAARAREMTGISRISGAP